MHHQTETPHTHSNKRKRRFDRFRRANRKLRDQVQQYKRLAIGSAAAAVALAFVLGFTVFDEPESDPVLLGTGRAGVMGVSASVNPEAPGAEPEGRVIGEGEASYYAEELAGQPTASGETFDPNKLTAAHRTLPLGTRVRVTNVNNGESVVVRINDRGPFAKRRVIDLSKAAAREVGLLRSGVGRVRLEVLS